MPWSDPTLTTRSLRQFAVIWLVFFAILAGVRGLQGHTASTLVVAGLALSIGLAGLLRPGLIRPIYVGATLLTFPIGWLVSRLVLAGLFYGVFTPVALLFRWIGRDALQRRPRPPAETYWAPKPMPPALERYYRPF